MTDGKSMIPETAPPEERHPWDVRATAYHEAGHAVVMLAFGLEIDEATISPDAERDSNGHISHPPPLGYITTGVRDRRSLVRAMILSSYAGMEAERLVDPDAPHYHGAGDADTAFYLSRTYEVLPRKMEYVGDDAHWRFLDRLKSEARHIVHDLRGPIGRLADELLSKTRLTGAEVEALVAPMLSTSSGS
jgi:ATP-dependent Zn protease